MDYQAAVAAAHQLAAQDGPEVNPLCRTRLLSHGARARRSIVLYHGITNCPQQFAALGAALHGLGYNVLIPRYPRHGLADRLTDSQRHLTTGELRRFASHTAEIGSGLGDHLTVSGLSLGGVVCGWLAQEREVGLAMPISALFAVPKVPIRLTRSIAVTLRLAPNLYLWWDPRLKAGLRPAYGYPRIASRAFAAMLGLGLEVQDRARSRRPRARMIVAVTNAHDPGVNNQGTVRLVRTWVERWRQPVACYQFEDGLGLPHDLIDPGNPEQNTEAVYPVLLDLLAQNGPPK